MTEQLPIVESPLLFRCRSLTFYANGDYVYEGLVVLHYAWRYDTETGLRYVDRQTGLQVGVFHEVYQEAYRSYLAKLVLE